MLQNIRERLTGKVALIILGAIALSFVFVGGASFTTVGSSYVANVDGIKISVNQFESAYRNQLQANPQLASLPSEFRLQLRKNIAEQLIQQQVIDNYLEKSGFVITNNQLIEAIHQFPEFHVDGSFDKKEYLTYLENVAMTPSTFENSLKDNLRRSQLQNSIRNSALVTPSEYRRYLNLAFEIRNVSTSEITPQSVVSDIDINEEMIIDFYDKNITEYLLPESVDFDYIKINRSDIFSEINIIESQLSNYYSINKDRFLQDERRRARHILILFNDNESVAEDTAKKVLGRINRGESFSKLALDFSEDSATSENGGDLGSLTVMQLPDALGEAIFSIQVGEVKGPVKGDFGFHIVRLDEVLESGPLPYSQVKATLLSEMQEDQAEQLYIDLKKELADALFDAVDIQQLADTFDIDVFSFKNFQRDTLEPFNGNELAADLIFDSKLLDSLKNNNVQLLTDIIELDADQTVVVSPTKHSPVKRDSLENVKNLIIESLTLEQSDSLMAKNAQQTLQAINEGKDFESAAADVGAIVNSSLSLMRNDKNFDKFLTEAIFNTPRPSSGKPSFGSSPNNNGGYTVYSLDSVIPGQPELIPLNKRDNGRLEFSNKTGLNDFVSFVQSLRDKADVEINESVLATQGVF